MNPPSELKVISKVTEIKRETETETETAATTKTEMTALNTSIHNCHRDTTDMNMKH